MFCCRWQWLLWMPVWAPAGFAEEAVLRAGDCAIYREGGVGRLFKSPTYWMRGDIIEIQNERHEAKLCPPMNKPFSAYSDTDWAELASSLPCVRDAARAGEVDVLRARLRVSSWDTPWSVHHGQTGWLFRGRFLGQPLERNGIIVLDVRWLDRCDR